MREGRNIVLTGFMGTGKSTVGKLAADRLNLQFVDTDEAIESRMQQTVSDIFSIYGEQYFREKENEIIKEYACLGNQVIATGGGAVLNPDNMDNLRANGLIILLKARPEVIYRNVFRGNNRPLLKSQNPLERIKELLEERDSFYKNNDWEIDVSDIAVEEVVDRIIGIYRSDL